MSLAITVGGEDRKPQYINESINIVEQLEDRANELSIQFVKRPGDPDIKENEEIKITDGERILFAGYITRIDPEEVGAGQLIKMYVEAADYTYLLQNKIIHRSFQEDTLKTIVEEIISDTELDFNYDITTLNVSEGPTIDAISFNFTTVQKAFEKLAERTGHIWWMDYERDIHFVAKDEATAPEEITEDSGNHISVIIARDATQIKNQLIVEGGRRVIEAPVTETFMGDGEKREWVLPEKPKEMVSIKINDVEKGFYVEYLQDQEDNDFSYNYQEKNIKIQNDELTTPGTADKIEVTYYHEVPLQVQIKHTDSIAALRKIDGGDGIHEDIIQDDTINSREEAMDRGEEEFEEFANPLINGTIETRSGLLQEGTVFEVGQQITVHLPTWGIESPTQYLIREVETRPIEYEGGIEYHYRIVFGGKMLGVRKFLEKLATRERKEDETAKEIDVFKQAEASPIVMKDIYSTESKTPPFKYGPATTGPVAVVNKSIFW